MRHIFNHKYLLNKHIKRLLLSCMISSAPAIWTYGMENTSYIGENDGPTSIIISNQDEASLATDNAPAQPNHFTWGADIGSSIDMSGNDMSSIDIDAHFGYKNGIIRTLGVGAGIKSAIGNSYTAIPVYAMLRTSFTRNPTLCFFDLKMGYSFNTLTDGINQNSFYGSAGLGFNLYTTQEFKSHIILAYTFMNMDSYYSTDNIYNNINNYSGLSVKIGINF